MERVDSSPFIPEVSEDWTFESALEAKKSSEAFLYGGGALVIIGVVGFIVAGAAAVVGLFTAALLIPAAVIGITSIALLILGFGLIKMGHQRAESLDDKKCLELAVEHFKEKILEVDEFLAMEVMLPIIKEINTLCPDLVDFWYSKELPELVHPLCIDDRQLTKEEVLDLLEVAYQTRVALCLRFSKTHPVVSYWEVLGSRSIKLQCVLLISEVLSLRSLKTPLTFTEEYLTGKLNPQQCIEEIKKKLQPNPHTWDDRTHRAPQKFYEKMIESLQLSFEFLKRCQEKDYSDIRTKNMILDALAVKIIPKVEGKPDYPVHCYIAPPALVYIGEDGEIHLRAYLLSQSRPYEKQETVTCVEKFKSDTSLKVIPEKTAPAKWEGFCVVKKQSYLANPHEHEKCLVDLAKDLEESDESETD